MAALLRFEFDAKMCPSTVRKLSPHQPIKGRDSGVLLASRRCPLPLRNARKIQAKERQTAWSSCIRLLDRPLAESAMISGDP
jgi:hypothetical protein